jgi:hypothetical protein
VITGDQATELMKLKRRELTGKIESSDHTTQLNHGLIEILRL